jgi:phosphopantothenoylcysteine decarboxylase/phosphopantothenate--cysteine ligase
MPILEGKTILLGVSGGIAAYKAASIASRLVQAGAHVEVMMTEAAQAFVQPLTFNAITHSAVHTDPFAPWSETDSGHVSLARKADLFVVAPATANTIAKLALGLADDLLGLVALSTHAPLLLAPAMENGMFHHPSTQAHLATLKQRGATIVGPEPGWLASGAFGDGRMSDPEALVDAVRRLLTRSGSLRGRRIVVTAGGTREPLDPVRFIGNRSSGRMGFAVARAALAAGAEVTLISGASDLLVPAGAKHLSVETTAELKSAVEEATIGADVLIMAAAVADFQPERRANQKIKKTDGTTHLELRLVRNPDILAELNRPDLLKIGFAAETEDLVENATRKLHAKGLAMVVANDAEATIGSPDTEATILTADGRVIPMPRMSKELLAETIVELVTTLLPPTDWQET